MRYLLIVLAMLLPAASVRADVSVSIGVAIPGVSIGIHVPAYPRLVRVPGHPVYYDPTLALNLFFYDGVYWVFYAGNWYMSSWYNGPWYRVHPFDVPIYLLRVPMRYYAVPPPFFYGKRADAPPPWHEHWGHEWAERRRDWEHADRRPPPPAPRPFYQRDYSGERYPREVERQREIHTERYRYQPREPVTRQYYGTQRERSAPPGHERREERGRH